MEKYKKVLKKRIYALLTVIVVAVVLMVVNVYLFIGKQDGSFDDGFLKGFQIGLLGAMFVYSLITIINYSHALKDEKMLQIQYNEEHDERLKAIQAKAGIPFVKYVAYALILIGIVAGYFNPTVFYTLIATVFALEIASAVVKIIFSHIM